MCFCSYVLDLMYVFLFLCSGPDVCVLFLCSGLDVCVFVLRRKNKEEERSAKPQDREKDKRFWDSITMTMRQITPTRKMDKMEGWEPPRLPSEPGDWGVPTQVPLTATQKGIVQLKGTKY